MSQSVAQRFAALAVNDMDMISDIQGTDYGCSYDWNGVMTCHIVEKDGVFYDVADCRPEDLESRVQAIYGSEQLQESSCFPTLLDLWDKIAVDCGDQWDLEN